MKTNTYLLLILILCVGSLAMAQEAEIESDGITFPKMASYPSSPNVGQVIYHTGNTQFEYWSGSAWTAFSGGTTGPTDKIEDSVDGDTYVSAKEWGSYDYIEYGFEGTGTVRMRPGPGGDIRIETLNSTNSANTFIGDRAGDATLVDGVSNTFIGYQAGSQNNTGDNNTFIGRTCGYTNTTGSRNAFVGRRAGYRNNDDDNTFIGYYAGTNSDNANKSVFIGAYAGENSEADFNVAIGYQAGRSCTNLAISNTFTGYLSGLANTNGSHNTYYGQSSGKANATGLGNTIVGSRAGEDNEGNYNSFLGYLAGADVSTGGSNTFNGHDAGRYSTSGDDNVYLGKSAGNRNTTGNRNVFLGKDAGARASNYVGHDNVYIGYEAGENKVESKRLRITNGGAAIPIIYGQFDNALVGINDEGPSANLHIKQVGSGEEGLAIENDTDTDVWSYEIGANDLNIYFNGVSKGYFNDVNGNYVPASDRRLKNSIATVKEILPNILKLNPTSYYLKSDREKTNKTFGFIAQEVHEIFPSIAQKFDDESELYSVDYTQIGVLAIKAMQEQQEMIVNLQSELSATQKRLLEVEAQLKVLSELVIK